MVILSGSVLAGEYSDGTNSPDAIDAGIPGVFENQLNPVFSGWAVTVVEYLPSDETESYGIDGIGPSPYTGNDFSDTANALGPVTTSDLDVVSLGDLNWEDGVTYDIDDEPGFITLSFPETVSNGPGPDFAVFENTFGSGGLLPAELAFVEVSTNGTDFARFPCYYNASSEPVGPYGYIDVTKIWNLAGKHINSGSGSWGTPFNLSDLSEHPLVLDNTVNIEQINYIRIVDIAGNGYFADSLGNPIYDAWETWGSGGFDLNAVGILENITGDGDSDGEVNFHDFLRLHKNWNKTGGWPQGDFNEDGFVDADDYLLLAGNWLYRNK
ncbi:hypothetical protein SMSP2_01159 [Limihaloglobus sulfuriphilus]|uniref:Dockerin domain-containing protein n=2 Tax=Limihaloglobus sulfuriphilus TaxID=1851148 RepID=A0A1Q2MES8_9BACT|nr:hypothetical protein SMSP2_01159 [Limihaloglobus sulfuriphilus]